MCFLSNTLRILLSLPVVPDGRGLHFFWLFHWFHWASLASSIKLRCLKENPGLLNTQACLLLQSHEGLGDCLVFMEQFMKQVPSCVSWGQWRCQHFDVLPMCLACNESTSVYACTLQKTIKAVIQEHHMQRTGMDLVHQTYTFSHGQMDTCTVGAHTQRRTVTCTHTHAHANTGTHTHTCKGVWCRIFMQRDSCERACVRLNYWSLRWSSLISQLLSSSLATTILQTLQYIC